MYFGAYLDECLQRPFAIAAEAIQRTTAELIINSSDLSGNKSTPNFNFDLGNQMLNALQFFEPFIQITYEQFFRPDNANENHSTVVGSR